MRIESAKRTRHIARSLLWCAVITSCTWSCKSAQKSDAVPVERALSLPPGVKGWSGQAQLLPASTPLVLGVRPDRVVSALDDLHEWLVSEPRMLGPDDAGIQRTQTLVNMRVRMASGLGVDLFDVETWSSAGLDVSTPILIGIIPVDPQGVAFVEQVEHETRTRLGIEESVDLLEALELADPKALSGLYASLSRTKRSLDEIGGARLVMGVRDASALVETMDRIAKEFDLGRVTQGVESTNLSRLYVWPMESTTALIGLRIEGSWATLDVTTAGEVDSDASALAAMMQTIEETPSGSPIAPRPEGEPGLFVAMNQSGVSLLLRHSNYLDALGRASRASATDRDTEFAVQLADAMRGQYAWELGAEGTSGVTYEIELGAPDRLGALEMVIFAAKGSTLPTGPRSMVGLQADRRAVGASIDPRFWGEKWGSWLDIARTDRLGYALSYDADGVASVFPYMLGLPRTLALSLANLDTIVREEAPLDLVPLYTHRDKLTGAEVVIPGIDLSTFERDPKLFGLISISPEVALIDRDVVSAAFHATLYFFSESVGSEGFDGALQVGPEDQESDPLSTLKAGEVRAFDVEATHPLRDAMYFYQREGETPFILVGYGVDRTQMEGQLQLIRQGGEIKTKSQTEEERRLLYLRGEPIGLVQIVSTYTPVEWSFVDLNLLAQRVGPIVAEIVATTIHGAPAVHYTIELKRPPRLEERGTN